MNENHVFFTRNLYFCAVTGALEIEMLLFCFLLVVTSSFALPAENEYREKRGKY